MAKIIIAFLMGLFFVYVVKFIYSLGEYDAVKKYLKKEKVVRKGVKKRK